MKNRAELERSWKAVKDKLKQKFAILTDNDALVTAGKLDEMLGRLEAKLGKSREELKKIIAEL
jgi:uncharacterized protein YjbJ (UPF0337 family)